MRVTLRDENRKLFGGEGRVLLQPAIPAADPVRARGGRPEIPLASARIVNGEAVFERLGLGLKFKVQAQLKVRGGAVEGVFDGPSTTERNRRVELSTAGPSRRISIAIQDADHEMLRGRQVRAYLWRGAEMTTYLLRTDAEGRVEVELGKPYDEGEERALLLYATQGRGHIDFRRSARVDLERAFPAGLSRFNAVRLIPAPVAAAGTVVDGDGQVVSGAPIQLVVNSRKQPEMWRSPTPEAQPVRTDAKGGFRVFGHIVGPELRCLVTTPDGATGEKTGITIGDSAVRIVVRHPAVLQFEWAAKLGMTKRWLKSFDVTLESQRDGELVPCVTSYESSKVKFSARRSGIYTLRLAFKGRASSFFETQVHLEEGKVLRPRSLRELDLNRWMRKIKLTLVDPNGRPIASAVAGAQMKKGLTAKTASKIPDVHWSTRSPGVIEMWVPNEGAFVRVWNTHQMVTLESLREDRRVVLRSQPKRK